jgi:hypothetical protein
MLPIISSIVSSLLANNLPKLAQAVVDKGVDYVQEKTGIELKPDMTPEDFDKLRQHEESMAKLRNEDASSARDREVKIATSQDAPYINKVVTPVLALGTVTLSFALFAAIMFLPDIEGSRKDILIYVLGAVNAATVQVLSYYFGASHDHKKDLNPSVLDSK